MRSFAMKGIAAMLGACLVMLSAGILFPSAGSAAAAGIEWKRAPLHSNDLQAIVRYDKDIWIAGGKDGALAYSEDGSAWTHMTSPVPGHLEAIATNGKRAVAVGNRGAVLTSVNGKSWTQGKIKISYTVGDFWGKDSARDAQSKAAMMVKYRQADVSLIDVIWDGSRFVALGDMAATVNNMGYRVPIVATTKDGAAWTLHPLFRTELMRDNEGALFAHQGKIFILRGDYVGFSTDLKAWTIQKSGIGVSVSDVVSNGKRLVAVGYDGRLASGSVKVQRTTGIIFTSTDGINWKEMNRSPGAQANENKGKVDLDWLPVNAVTWDGERFIAGTNQGQTLVSPDGLTWKFIIPEQDIRVENIPLLHQTHGGLRADIFGIYGDKEQVITVGSLGTIRTAAPAMATWQVTDGGEVRALSKAAASGGRVVALGQGIIVESNDGGRHWDVHRSEEIERSYFYSFVADKGKFAVRGIDRSDGRLDSFLYTSDAPGSWNMHPESQFASDPLDVYVADGQFIAMLRKGTAASANGQSWTNKAIAKPLVEELANNGRVSVGRRVDRSTEDTALMYRDKGSQKWKPAHYVTSSVDKIASDGADWQEVHTSYGMNAIAYGKGMYVVVCRGGKLLISKDGVHWEEKDSISAEDLEDIVWDGKQFIIVGTGGTILLGSPK